MEAGVLCFALVVGFFVAFWPFLKKDTTEVLAGLEASNWKSECEHR